jgi:DNA-binding FadR family transcriptional regulator
MDQVRDELGESRIHAATEAACHALISLERVSARLPDSDQLSELQSEIDQARESLREAIRELRLAGVVKPSIQELDFVLPS